MAYVQILNNRVVFSGANNLKIYESVWYDAQRSGTSMQYRIKTNLTLPNGWFYKNRINEQIHLDGVNQGIIQVKENTSGSWTGWSRTVETGWMTVPNKLSGTTALSLRVWDTQDSSQLNYTFTYNLPIIMIPPSSPTTQYVNGGKTATVTERNSTVTLSWNTADGGTLGVSGYKIYWSRGAGWQYLTSVSADTRSYNTTIADLYNDLARGSSLGFQITAYNSSGESSVKPGVHDNNTLTLALMTSSASTSNVRPNQATVSWNSNIAIKTVEWKLSTETSWRTVQSNLNTTSSSFTATGLTYNKYQTIQVRLTARSDNTQSISSTSLTTQDIARLTKVPAEWSVEDPATITISNPGNCALQLYIKYNNVEVISRTNITLTNGTYTLTLTDSEKSLLYSQASSDKNPSFYFVLKSFISTKIGEDSKATLITFPTKAWTKVNNSWKRALVWAKMGSSWRQSIPWVKVGSTWKRI